MMESHRSTEGLAPAYAKRRAVVRGTPEAEQAFRNRFAAANERRWGAFYAQPSRTTRCADIYLGPGADGRGVYLAGDDDCG
jgi:hypothetical protein